MKKAYSKSILREFKSSITRFLSILAIIFLGVAFYIGIRATGPNMVNTAQNFFDESQLLEMRIVSSFGLTSDDYNLALSDPNIKDVVMGYSLDLLQPEDNEVIKVMSYDKTSSMNLPYLMEGHLPTNKNEITLDANMMKHYSLGDEYTLAVDKDNEDKLTTTKFTIVGFAYSPMYIENTHRGYTNIGKGTVDSIVFLDQQVFDMDVYTDMYLKFKDMEGIKAFSQEYDDTLDKDKESIKTLYSKRPTERLNELKKEPLDKLNQAKVDLDSGSKEFNEAKLKLDEGWVSYNSGKSELDTGYQTYLDGLAKARAELNSGQAEIDANLALLNDGKAQADAAKIELDQAFQQLEVAKSTFEGQGIDPNASTENLEAAQKALQYAIDHYDDLSGLVQDIKVEDIKEASKVIRDYIKDKPEYAQALPYLDKIDEILDDPNFNEKLGEYLGQSKEELIKLNNQLIQLISGIKQYQAGLISYNDGYAKWSASNEELNKGFNELELAQTKINEGWNAYYKNKAEMDSFFATNQSELNTAYSDLINGQSKLDENKLKLEDGYKEYEDGLKELDKIETPKYYFFDRDSYPGYTEFYQNTLRVSSIADVIPIFFFSIAALISLTTMTRMVEEKRSEIGTLKGLGYSNRQISKKFMVYAGLATTIGVVLGVLFGSHVFPTLIYNAYKALYNIQDFVIEYQPVYIIQSIAFSFACTIGATYAVLRTNLKSTPAALMIPKAPKMGKKILLERITPIWKRLSFSMKVTFRNVFRYKQRMIMTIIGIAGCTALVMIGFGLKDSINDISKKQFGNIWLYDAQIAYKDDYSSTQKAEFDKIFSSEEAFDSQLMNYQASFEAINGKTNISTTIVVPSDVSEFENYVNLKNRSSGTHLELSDNGVYLTEKASKLLDVKVGDTLTLRKDKTDYEVPFVGISENYVSHFIYMTPNFYKEHIDKDITYNSSYVLMNSSTTNQDALALELMDTGVISNITFMTSTLGSTMDAMKSIDMVVVILIVSAGLLALIVLYNLSNINVSERIRELSTIKVLGFYDNEVTKYVYRENIILSILGIAVGFVLGFFLHRFVITVAEVDEIMFSPNIHVLSYAISGLLTMFFTVVVLVIMHYKLKKINMIDALKSND